MQRHIPASAPKLNMAIETSVTVSILCFKMPITIISTKLIYIEIIPSDSMLVKVETGCLYPYIRAGIMMVR